MSARNRNHKYHVVLSVQVSQGCRVSFTRNVNAPDAARAIVKVTAVAVGKFGSYAYIAKSTVERV